MHSLSSRANLLPLPQKVEGEVYTISHRYDTLGGGDIIFVGAKPKIARVTSMTAAYLRSFPRKAETLLPA